MPRLTPGLLSTGTIGLAAFIAILAIIYPRVINDSGYARQRRRG